MLNILFYKWGVKKQLNMMTGPRSFRFVIYQAQTLLFIHAAWEACELISKHISSLDGRLHNSYHNSRVDVSLIWFNVLKFYAWVLNSVASPSLCHSGWVEQTTNKDVSKTLRFDICQASTGDYRRIQCFTLSLFLCLTLSLIIREVSKQNWEETERSIQIIPEQTAADSLNCSICLPKIGQFILISAK